MLNHCFTRHFEHTYLPLRARYGQGTTRGQASQPRLARSWTAAGGDQQAVWATTTRAVVEIRAERLVQQTAAADCLQRLSGSVRLLGREIKAGRAMSLDNGLCIIWNVFCMP